jgi:NADP-dependent 3-hydroxy acid dehydrogenase YdfG
VGNLEERLVGQGAVVTGAGRGIGRAVAVELARLGMRVGLVSRTPAELESVAAEIGNAAVVAAADVRSPAEVAGTLGNLRDRFGTIRVVVNAAGVYHYGPVVETTGEDLDRVVDTNLKGTFTVCRHVLPGMIAEGGGEIVNIASIAGKVGTPGRAIYCASKFGVVGFSYALAEEVREQGIRVTLVCPGSTNTRFSPKERTGKSLDRMLQPVDIAHTVRMIVTQDPRSFMSEIIMRPTRKP